MNRKSLPPGWSWRTLAEIAAIKGGITKGQRRALHVPTRTVPYLRVANVQRGYLDLSIIKEIEATEEEIQELRLLRNDILFNEGGDRDKLGRGWIWSEELPECIHQNHVFRARLRSNENNAKYVSWYGNSVGAKYFIEQGTQTTNLASINLTKLGKLPIALPPPAEQQLIVEIIDVQLSRLDFADTLLRRIQHNLKLHRVSVLRESLRGALNNNLPSNWNVIKVKDAGKVQLGRQRSPKNHQGPHMRPYLRVANVFEDRIDTADVMSMNFSPAEYEIFCLKDNDILLNEGQSPELVGRPAIYRGEVPGACFQNTLIRFRANKQVLPRYALIVFRAYLHAKKFHEIARWTTNIAHLGVDRFANMPFPLPPITEQEQIIAEVDRQLSSADAVGAQVDKDLQRSNQLRQAILTLAFEGKLTRQAGAVTIAEHERVAGTADGAPLSLNDTAHHPLVSQSFPHNPIRRSRNAMAQSTRKIRTLVSGGLAHRSLVDVLRENSGGLSPEDLFRQAGFSEDLDVDQFYRELAEAVSKKQVRQLRPNNETILLLAEDA